MRSSGYVMLLALVLAACGGGNGESEGASLPPPAPVVSNLSFPLQAASNALTASGYAKNYTISGDCSGTASESVTPTSAGGAFEGNGSVLSAQIIQTLNFSNCLPSTSTNSETFYYDTNYRPLGSSASGSYVVYPTPFSLPSTVTVGVSLNLGSYYEYADSSKSTLLSRGDLLLHVEADTATTALINVVLAEYAYDASIPGFSGVFIQQSRSRIRTTGALEPLSISMQISPSGQPTVNLLLK